MASHPGAAPNSVTANSLREMWAERSAPEDVLADFASIAASTQPMDTLPAGVVTCRRDLPRGNTAGAGAGAGKKERDEFVDDDALLAVDLDALIASATLSPAGPALHPQSAAAAASTTPAALEFVDDDALLALDLDGIVAAASPSPSRSPAAARQHTRVMPEHTDKIAQNNAKTL